MRHPGRLPVPSPCQRGISSGRGCVAGGIVGGGGGGGRAEALSAAPSPGHGTGSRFAPLFQVAATRAPSPSPPPPRRPRFYLSMQHFVARFSGALLPWGLFPYLGGKMNRETERGPRLASGRLAARAALPGRGLELGRPGGG